MKFLHTLRALGAAPYLVDGDAVRIKNADALDPETLAQVRANKDLVVGQLLAERDALSTLMSAFPSMRSKHPALTQDLEKAATQWLAGESIDRVAIYTIATRFIDAAQGREPLEGERLMAELREVFPSMATAWSVAKPKAVVVDHSAFAPEAPKQESMRL